MVFIPEAAKKGTWGETSYIPEGSRGLKKRFVMQVVGYSLDVQVLRNQASTHDSRYSVPNDKGSCPALRIEQWIGTQMITYSEELILSTVPEKETEVSMNESHARRTTLKIEACDDLCAIRVFADRALTPDTPHDLFPVCDPSAERNRDPVALVMEKTTPLVIEGCNAYTSVIINQTGDVRDRIQCIALRHGHHQRPDFPSRWHAYGCQ